VTTYSVTRTLVDVARDRTDPFEAGIISTFLERCDAAKVAPIQTIGTTAIGHRRSNSAGEVGFRKRGEGFTGVARRTYDEVVDATYSMGCEIEVDTRDLKDKGLSENPMVKATREGVEDMTYTFNHWFFNGDQAVDEDGFDGMKVRHANLASSQTTYAIDSSTALDMTRLANSNAGPTVGDCENFLDAIDDTIETLDGRSADVCFTDAAGIRAIKRAERRLSIYKDTPPSEPLTDSGMKQRTSATPISRSVYTYAGVNFINLGYRADQTTHIVGTETIGGKATTPFYFVKLGKPYFWCIEQFPIDIGETFLKDDGVTMKTVVEWPVGEHTVHPRWGAKLAGVYC
jgi:hypothetical protein